MEISGKILDSSSEPLVSASITIKNGVQANKLGATSNLDGNFSLNNEVIDENSIFEVSYMGMKSQTLSTDELQNVNVIMLDEIEAENQVANTVQGKPNILASINTKDFKLNIRKEYLIIAVLIVGGYYAYKKFKK